MTVFSRPVNVYLPDNPRQTGYPDSVERNGTVDFDFDLFRLRKTRIPAWPASSRSAFSQWKLTYG
jgi:hypothetical protein